MNLPADPRPVADVSGPVAWVRRCNGAEPGEVVGYVTAVWCAQQDGVIGTLEGGLAWTARGTQDPRSAARDFTLTPLTAEQLADWHDRAAGAGA